MRRLLITVLVIALAVLKFSVAHAVINPHVQSAQKNTTGASDTLAFPSAVTAGSLKLMALRTGSVSDTVTAVSDDLDGAWTRRGYVSIIGESLYVYEKANATAGTTTVSITLSGSVTLRWAILEASGLDTAPFDVAQTGVGATPGTTITTAATATTAVNDELLFGAIGVSDGGTANASFTAGTGYTSRQQVVVGGTNLKMGIETRVVSATGAYVADATITNVDTWGAIIATYKATGGTPPPAAKPREPIIVQ